MLVVRRKAEEGILLLFLRRKISIHILSIERDRVKIGISAPSDVAIVREELLDRAAEQEQEGEQPSH